LTADSTPAVILIGSNSSRRPDRLTTISADASTRSNVVNRLAQARH
jgi:hypothetical protein